MAEEANYSPEITAQNEMNIQHGNDIPHRDNLLQWMEISVSDPEKRTTGATVKVQDNFIVYLVESKVIDQEMPGYRDPPTSLWRRYSDFELLRNYLEVTYQHVVIPPLPEKRVSHGWQKLPTDRFDPDFIERRRQGLENFLLRCASHGTLSKDSMLMGFLKMDDGWRNSVYATDFQSKAEWKIREYSASFRLKKPDARFEAYRNYCSELQTHINNILKIRAKLCDRWYGVHRIHGNYGRVFSEWSAMETDMADGLQTAGHYMDVYASNVDTMLDEDEQFADQLKEYYSFGDALRSVCRKQELVQLDLEKLEDSLSGKGTQKEALESGKTSMIGSLKSKVFGSETPEQRDAKIKQLEEQIQATEQQLETSTAEAQQFVEAALKDISRFERQKTKDIKEILINYCIAQIEKCRKMQLVPYPPAPPPRQTVAIHDVTPQVVAIHDVTPDTVTRRNVTMVTRVAVERRSRSLPIPRRQQQEWDGHLPGGQGLLPRVGRSPSQFSVDSLDAGWMTLDWMDVNDDVSHDMDEPVPAPETDTIEKYDVTAVTDSPQVPPRSTSLQVSSRSASLPCAVIRNTHSPSVIRRKALALDYRESVVKYSPRVPRSSTVRPPGVTDRRPQRQQSHYSQMHKSIYYDVKKLQRNTGVADRCLHWLCRRMCLHSRKHMARKAAVTFSAGLLLCTAIYVIIYYSRRAFAPSFTSAGQGRDLVLPLWAIGVMAFITVTFSLAVAFSMTARAVTSLMLPALFTSRGRALIATILVHLLLSGPFFNFLENAQKLPEATRCQAALLANESRVIQTQLYQQFVSEYEQRAGLMMNHTVSFLRNTFYGWQELYNMPGAVRVEVSKFEVDFAGLTFNSTDFEGYENKIFFAVDSGEPEVVSSKPIAGFFLTIKATLERFISSVKSFLSGLFIVLPWTIILLFIQSLLYHKGYTNRLEYDNHYITQNFKTLDYTRFTQGHRALLPLTYRERAKYVDSTSLVLARRELGGVCLGVLLVALLGLFGVILFALDAGFFYLMELVNEQVNATLTITGAVDVKPEYSDVSPKVRRLLEEQLHFLKQFNMSYNSTTDMAECIPVLSQPYLINRKSLTTTITLYALMFFVTLLQAYGMRLQHRIASYFYPEQERKRIMYLYQSIESRRVSFARILFGSFRKNTSLPPFNTWFQVRYPRVSRLLQAVGILKPHMCDFCAEQDAELLAVGKYLCCEGCVETHRQRYQRVN